MLDLDEEMLLTLAEVHEQQWTRTEHLLATVVEVLQEVLYVQQLGLAVHQKNPAQVARKIPKPEPVQRPGVQRRKRRRGTTLGELAAMGARPQFIEGEVTDGDRR